MSEDTASFSEAGRQRKHLVIPTHKLIKKSTMTPTKTKRQVLFHNI